MSEIMNAIRYIVVLAGFRMLMLLTRPQLTDHVNK